MSCDICHYAVHHIIFKTCNKDCKQCTMECYMNHTAACKVFTSKISTPTGGTARADTVLTPEITSLLGSNPGTVAREPDTDGVVDILKDFRVKLRTCTCKTSSGTCGTLIDESGGRIMSVCSNHSGRKSLDLTSLFNAIDGLITQSGGI